MGPRGQWNGKSHFVKLGIVSSLALEFSTCVVLVRGFVRRGIPQVLGVGFIALWDSQVAVFGIVQPLGWRSSDR